MRAPMPGPQALEPAQELKRIDTLDRLEQARAHGQLPDFVGRPSAVGRVGEHIVDRQHSAGRHMTGPGPIVAERRLHRMAAIDEQEADRPLPPAAQQGRRSDQRHDRVFKTRARNRAPEFGQRVDPAQLGIEQVRVVILFSGLVFFRAAMVIDGEQHLAGLARRPSQIDA